MVLYLKCVYEIISIVDYGKLPIIVIESSPNTGAVLTTLDERTTVNILYPQAKLDSAMYQCVSKSAAAWSTSDTDIKVLAREDYAEGLCFLSLNY